MRTHKIPFETMVFVCTHKREDEAACDNNCDSGYCGTFWVDLLRDEVKNRGLKGKVRVVKSGCLDVCAGGPNLMIVRPQQEPVWISHLEPSDRQSIIEKVFEMQGNARQ